MIKNYIEFVYCKCGCGFTRSVKNVTIFMIDSSLHIFNRNHKLVIEEL